MRMFGKEYGGVLIERVIKRTELRIVEEQGSVFRKGYMCVCVCLGYVSVLKQTDEK